MRASGLSVRPSGGERPNIIYHSSTCHFHFRAKAAAEETSIVDLKAEIAELKIALDSARSQGNV